MRRYDDENVFAKILRGDLPCDKVYEDEQVLAFYDIHPLAAVHVVVIPKFKAISFDDFMQHESRENISHFFATIQSIAKSLGLSDSGYRLITNHGVDADQTIFHFHVHLLGHQKLGPILTAEIS